jgi:ABC-type branched-subunit amino acid transport system substrate-binding protein
MGMTSSSGTRKAPLRHWIIPAAVASIAAMVLSACGGSSLDPEDVLRANRAISGTSNAGGDTPAPDVVAPGPNTPIDPTTGVPVDNNTGKGSNNGGGVVVVGGGGGGGNGGGGKPAPATGSGVRAGSCAGFKNQTGIDDKTIKLGNIVDITGPVPGFFTPAQQAAQAYIAYFNSTSNLCGRKFQIVPFDSGTNAAGDNTGAQKACEQTFAAVGSMAAFDLGGAATTERCGLPDLRAVQTNAARTECSTCFSAEGPGNGEFPTAVPQYFLKKHRDLTQHAAMFYVGEAASVSNALGQVKAEERVGWKFDYVGRFDVAEFNYSPYIQQMKAKGVKLVQFFGSSGMAARMAQSMAAADFHPQLLINAAVYDKTYGGSGSPVENTILYVDFAPLEEVNTNPEMRLYYQWLQQVSPGAKMSYFGLFAWSATRLFVERAVMLGGQLTRANMIKSIKQVHNWSANGLHPPMDVGGKTPSRCWRFVQLKAGQWKPYGGTKYTCGGIVSSN